MSFSLSISGKKGKKQYGLVLPKSKQKDSTTTFNVFAAAAAQNEDQSNENNSVGRQALNSVEQKKVEAAHSAALQEDPSVFDYDGVYDSITEERNKQSARAKAAREKDKKSSKYIGTLKEKAKVREMEHERMRERRLLKERQKEDELYGDKEKLVSASYKRKLMEMKQWEQEDKRLDAVEEAEDVTKRGDEAMASFYSNLMNKNLAMGGDVKHAKSAYTTAATDKAETEKKEVSDSRKRKSPEPEAKKLVKTPEIEDSKVPSQKEDNTPSQSKEDAIAAAKARFLARKKAKQT